MTSVQEYADAVNAGTHFAISPGLTEHLPDNGPAPLLPGVTTATEIMVARNRGFRTSGFFSTVAMGGTAAFFNARAGPYDLPDRGINDTNAAQFLALPKVIYVDDSWVAPSSGCRLGNDPNCSAEGAIPHGTEIIFDDAAKRS